MKRSHTRYQAILSCAFTLAVARLPLLGQDAKRPLPTKQPPAHSARGTIWKSETTQKEYRVRIEKNRFYAEWVNIPADSAKQGVYIRSECSRVGAKCVGTSRVFLLCPESQASRNPTKGCAWTFRFEVDEISPNRISGRSESLRNFDCQKCEVRQTGWANFVWVPKGKAARGAGRSAATADKK